MFRMATGSTVVEFQQPLLGPFTKKFSKKPSYLNTQQTFFIVYVTSFDS